MNEFATQYKQSKRYRDGLAKRIKDQPDKDAKQQILISEIIQNSSEYHTARTYHNFERVFKIFENRLIDICNQSNNLDCLEEQLRNTDIIVPNENAGLDRIEHLLKRLKLARLFSCPNILPESGGFREKVANLMEAEQVVTKDQVSREEYREYLKDRYSNLDLSESEIERVIDKIPLSVFVSIDHEMEEIIIMINALEGTVSNMSCFGHDNDDVNLDINPIKNNMYVTLTTNHRELADELINTYSAEIISISSDEKEITLGIFYNDKPSSSWIADHGKRTEAEIMEDCRSRAEVYFGTSIDSVDEKEFDDLLFKLQVNKIKENPDMATKPYRNNTEYLREVNDMRFINQRYKEYIDYYISEEHKAVKRQLLNDLMKKLSKYRKKD